eukprot:1767718-Pyramimonas_sp.AAC.1
MGKRGVGGGGGGGESDGFDRRCRIQSGSPHTAAADFRGAPSSAGALLPPRPSPLFSPIFPFLFLL